MNRIKLHRTRIVLSLLVSLLAAAVVTWFVPSLAAASFNLLFRWRGALAPAADIVIVAVDDASLQRVGRWPWRRAVMAEVLEKIAEFKPQAIGLDIIYAESTSPADDQRLAEAMRQSGRVVLPAQLIETEPAPESASSTISWLLPLPQLAGAAAAIGHAHAAPDVDGILRSIQLSKADDQAQRLWALGLEIVRVAEQIRAEEVSEQAGLLRVGQYRINLRDEVGEAQTPGITIIRPNEILINYTGPTGSFPQISVADILADAVPAGALTDKIVLIGATAPSLGDTQISPFMHYGAEASQGGLRMPGIEVHANVVNTIRSRLWFQPLPDWANGLAMFGVILLAAVIAERFDGWRQLVGLTLILAGIIFGSLYAFASYRLIPPLPALLTGLITVVPLLSLSRAFAASRDLDRKLANLVNSQIEFLPGERRQLSLDTIVTFIATLLGAETVALFLKSGARGQLNLKSYAGSKPTVARLITRQGNIVPAEAAVSSELVIPIRLEDQLLGALLVTRAAPESFNPAEQRLLGEVTDGLATALKRSRRTRLTDGPRLNLPQNLEWKLNAVDELTTRLITRVGFLNSVFASMTDGVLVADITGQIIFATQRAARLFHRDPAQLVGVGFVELLTQSGLLDETGLRAALGQLTAGEIFQTELKLIAPEVRYYSVQLLPVVAIENAVNPAPTALGGPPRTEAERRLGVVAIISDITKRKELDQLKTETLRLVSHELRTPLTSIQGLSDVLLKFPVAADEAQEVLKTIQAEAVRLGETINRYLDITRLESGTQPLKLVPVELGSLLGACRRALAPVAAARNITLRLTTAPSLPRLQADAQLLTQAVTNLISNAIKYSPAGTEVLVEAGSSQTELWLRVQDHGYGIPAESLERIFEKFYRLERDQAAEIVGTGLGLSLVREIVEQHQGRIEVTSELGQGSTFRIILPRA